MRIKVKKTGQAITTAGSGYKKGDMVRVDPTLGSTQMPVQQTIKGAVINDPYKLRITGTDTFLGKTIQVGYNGIIRFGDGVDWFYMKKTSHNFTSVFVNGDQCLIGATDGTVMVSTDLMNWDVTAVLPNGVAAINISGVITTAGEVFNLVGGKWVVTAVNPVQDYETNLVEIGLEVATSTTSVSDLTSVTVFKDIQYAVDQAGLVVMSYGDGYWFITNSSMLSDGLATDGNKLVSVTKANRVRVSQDGITWGAATTLPTIASISGISYTDSQFLVYGDNDSLVTSPDAVTWTYIRDDYELVDIVSNTAGTIFMGLLADGKLVRSTDGNTWYRVLEPVLKKIDMIAFFSGNFVAAGSNRLVVSTNAIDFSEKTTGAVSNISALKAGTSKLLIMSGNVAISTTDLVTFASTTLQITPDKIQFQNNYYLAFTTTQSRLFYSDDCITWYETLISTSGTNDYIRSATEHNGEIYFAASRELRKSSDGNEFTRVARFPMAEPSDAWDVVLSAGSFMIWGSGVNLYKSTDLTNWTITASNVGVITKLKKVNGKYFAFLRDSAYKVLISDDGETWQTKTYASDTIFTDLTFFKGKYYMVGTNSGSAVIHQSTDLVSFTQVAITSGYAHRSIDSNESYMIMCDGSRWTFTEDAVTWSVTVFNELNGKSYESGTLVHCGDEFTNGQVTLNIRTGDYQLTPLFKNVKPSLASGLSTTPLTLLSTGTKAYAFYAGGFTQKVIGASSSSDKTINLNKVVGNSATGSFAGIATGNAFLSSPNIAYMNMSPYRYSGEADATDIVEYRDIFLASVANSIVDVNLAMMGLLMGYGFDNSGYDVQGWMRTLGNYTTITYYRDLDIFHAGTDQGYMVAIQSFLPYKDGAKNDQPVRKMIRTGNSYFCLFDTKYKKRDAASFIGAQPPNWTGVNSAVWTQISFLRSSFTASKIRKMAKLGDVFMGVNALGKPVVRTAHNVWMNPTLATTNKMNDVISTDTKFVLVGDAGEAMTATTYNDFASVTASSSNLLAVHGSTAMLYAAGNNATIIKSTNGGATWTNLTCYGMKMYGQSGATLPGFKAINVTGGLVTAVGNSSIISTLSTSATAFNYTQLNKEALDFVVPIGNRFVAYSGANYVMTSADCITWVRDESYYHPSYDVTQFAWSSTASQKVVGIGPIKAGNTNPTILSTTNGITWVARSNPSTRTLNRIVAGANGYVAVGDTATIIQSTDGITWTLNTSADNTGIAYNASIRKYVVVGNNGYAGYKSLPDNTEINWTTGWATAATDRNYNFKSVISVGDKFIATADGGRVMYSTNGTTWGVTATDSPINLQACAFSTIAGKDLYVAVGDNGKVMTSPDCLVFTSRTSGIASNLNSIIFDNGKYIAVGDSGKIVTSTNAFNWTTRVSGVGSRLNKVAKFGTKYIAVGDGGVILTSSDAVTWDVMTSTTTKNLKSIAVVGISAFVVGDGGTVLKSVDGLSWVAVDLGITDNFLNIIHAVEVLTSKTTYVTHILGKGKVHYRSTDYGVTWTDVTVKYQYASYDTEYRVSPTKTGNANVISSTNGVNWYNNTSSVTFNNSYMVIGSLSVRYEDDKKANKYSLERGLTARVTNVDSNGGVLSLDLFGDASTSRFKYIVADDEAYAASGPLDMKLVASSQINKHEGRVRKLVLSTNTTTTLPSSSNPMFGQLGNQIQAEDDFVLVRALKDGVDGVPLVTPYGGYVMGADQVDLRGQFGDVMCDNQFKNSAMAATKYEVRDATGAVVLAVDADYAEINRLSAGVFVAVFVEHKETTSTIKYYYKKNASTAWALTASQDVSGLMSTSLREGICLKVTAGGVYASIVDSTVEHFPDVNTPVYSAGTMLPYSRGGKNYFVKPCLKEFGQYANVELFQGIYAVMMAEVFENVGGSADMNSNKNIGPMPFLFDISAGTCIPKYDVFNALGLVGQTFTKAGTKDGLSFYNNQPRFYSFAANSSCVVAAAKVPGKENLVDVYTFNYSLATTNMSTKTINRVDTGVESFTPVIVPRGSGVKFAMFATTVFGNGSIQVYDGNTGAQTNTSPGSNKDYGKNASFNFDGSNIYIGDPMFTASTSGTGGIANFVWTIKELNPAFKGEQIESITVSFTEGGAITPCPPITMAGVGNVGSLTEYYPCYTEAGGGSYTRPADIKVTVEAIS